MFVKINKIEEELIKQTGKLSLQMNPFVSPTKKSEKIEHIVIYSNRIHDCYPTSIFSCLVTIMIKSLLIEDLTIRTVGITPICENLLHLFLGWTIELAPKWAEELNKEHVFIQTKLKHCTEWFIEHGYDVRKVNEMHDYGFSGLKTIKKLTNSTIGDFIQ